MYKDDGFDLVFSYTFPKCDLDGSYQAVQENSTHKICVDKEGSVLTAVDKIENKTLADAMDCNCLRANLIITSVEKPTCEVNGNYSPIQCRRGTCRCVDNNGNQVCKSSVCEVAEIDRDTLKC
ncbi:thyroglobulin-like [Anoplophora glabripennis]|uniref:thyroglobulin-like n=1 Tax=Anoplophora glabripennis TaxID=217634 RepID=UPI000C76FB43|nr:thyroglobulin-like [Anoplophora glabripennis]